MKYIFIMIGGSLGAVARYIVSGVIYKHIESIFPWGTFVVNILGAFTIGFLWVFFSKSIIAPETRLIICVGFLGAFTTFSTYSLETLKLINDGEINSAILNIVITNLSGLIAVFLGVILSRYVTNLIGWR